MRPLSNRKETAIITFTDGTTREYPFDAIVLSPDRDNVVLTRSDGARLLLSMRNIQTLEMTPNA